MLDIIIARYGICVTNIHMLEALFGCICCKVRGQPFMPCVPAKTG